MRNYMSDQFALRTRLLQCPTYCHAQYLRCRREFTLRLSHTAELSRVDANFHTLKALELVPPPNWNVSPHPLWMFPDSIWLVDKRVALPQTPSHSHNVVRRHTRTVQRTFMDNPQIRAEEGAMDIGVCLDIHTGGVDSVENMHNWNCGIGTRLCGQQTPPGRIWRRSGGNYRPSIRGRIHTPLDCLWQHTWTQTSE